MPNKNLLTQAALPTKYRSAPKLPQLNLLIIAIDPVQPFLCVSLRERSKFFNYSPSPACMVQT